MSRQQKITLRRVDNIARKVDAYDPDAEDIEAIPEAQSVLGWFWRLIGKR